MTTTEQPVQVSVPTDNGGDPPPAPDASVGDLFRWIYRFFYSKTVGLLIILAVTVYVFVGVWIQKTEIFSSPLFIVLIGMLALSIIGCTVHRIPTLWERWRHPRLHVPDRFFDRARYRAAIDSSSGTDAAMAAARRSLKSRHYRVIADPKDPEHRLFADKYSWGGFGTVTAHASFIVIIAAFAISAFGGVEELKYVPVEGEAVEVGHGSGLTLEASAFSAPADSEGRPLDFVAHLILKDGDMTVAEQDVRVNNPLRYHGMKFHQAAYGNGADVTITDADGKVLYSGMVPLDRSTTDGTRSAGIIELPGTGYDVGVFTPASGAELADLAAGQAEFLLYPNGGKAIDSQTADQGEPVKLGDFQATFDRERRYTAINLREDPGAIWMWIGSILLVGGMTITFLCRPRRLWVRIDQETGQVALASSDKEDSAFTNQFKALAVDISSALESRQSKSKEEQL